ncbi:MAG TPA: heparinase II/III family protein, partial [Candidatus Acidoferrales bacterium]|nr:heparinase II/III family protein [Candidatus Acidoferrales bacterium]
FWPGLPFRMVDDTRSNAQLWRTGAERVEFAGEHSRYRRLRGRVGVTRRVTLDRRKGVLMIHDTLRGSGTHELQWNFHLAPEIVPEPLQSGEKFSSDLLAVSEFAPDAAGFLFQAGWRIGPMRMIAAAPDNVRLKTQRESGWVAPRYGQREQAAIVQLGCEAKLPVSVAFVFVPAENV